MILKKGSKGEQVKQIQEFLNITTDGDFGQRTKNAVIAWQRANGLTADGIVGTNTLALMGITLVEESEFDEKYKNVMIQGSTFPDKPINRNLKIKLSKEMTEKYLPALEQAMGSEPIGFKLLCTIMAHKEGYYKGTRSYRTNNPGNIGNTDSGRNRRNSTLIDGVLLQKNYIHSIVAGQHRAYPIGKQKVIRPYFSPEIARNAKTYGLSPYLPGYTFVFTGQLDQFVKIYSTGARGGNSYLSMIISYFNGNGIVIHPESKIQDIITLS